MNEKRDILTQATPDFPCCDVWPRGLPDPCRDAYQALAKQGEIQIKRVTCSKSLGMVVVEYLSNAPHAWILDALARERDGESTKQQEMPL